MATYSVLYVSFPVYNIPGMVERKNHVEKLVGQKLLHASIGADMNCHLDFSFKTRAEAEAAMNRVGAVFAGFEVSVATYDDDEN